MDRNGPVWCRNNIDYLTERVAANAGIAIEKNMLFVDYLECIVQKIGITLIISAAIRISQRKTPTLLQKITMKIAKRRFQKLKTL